MKHEDERARIRMLGRFDVVIVLSPLFLFYCCSSSIITARLSSTRPTTSASPLPCTQSTAPNAHAIAFPPKPVHSAVPSPSPPPSLSLLLAACPLADSKDCRVYPRYAGQVFSTFLFSDEIGTFAEWTLMVLLGIPRARRLGDTSRRQGTYAARKRLLYRSRARTLEPLLRQSGACVVLFPMRGRVACLGFGDGGLGC